MPKNKILGLKHLNQKLGLFDNSHNYNLSEKSILSKPFSFQLWAVAYVVDKVAERWNFKEIAFMMMFTDCRYLEESFVSKRTGWSKDKCNDLLHKMLDAGYFSVKKPKNDMSIYRDKVYRVAYKYYPTHKYKAFIKRVENALKELHEEIDEYKKKGLEPPNPNVKGINFNP